MGAILIATACQRAVPLCDDGQFVRPTAEGGTCTSWSAPEWRDSIQHLLNDVGAVLAVPTAVASDADRPVSAGEFRTAQETLFTAEDALRPIPIEIPIGEIAPGDFRLYFHASDAIGKLRYGVHLIETVRGRSDERARREIAAGQHFVGDGLRHYRLARLEMSALSSPPPSTHSEGADAW